MIVAGIAAIRIELLKGYWLIMVILGLVGLIATFIYNKYIAKGGAIYLNGSLSNILINNSRFGVNGYNRADYGGAIFSSSSAS